MRHAWIDGERKAVLREAGIEVRSILTERRERRVGAVPRANRIPDVAVRLGAARRFHEIHAGFVPARDALCGCLAADPLARLEERDMDLRVGRGGERRRDAAKTRTDDDDIVAMRCHAVSLAAPFGEVNGTVTKGPSARGVCLE